MNHWDIYTVKTMLNLLHWADSYQLEHWEENNFLLHVGDHTHKNNHHFNLRKNSRGALMNIISHHVLNNSVI